MDEGWRGEAHCSSLDIGVASPNTYDDGVTAMVRKFRDSAIQVRFAWRAIMEPQRARVVSSETSSVKFRDETFEADFRCPTPHRMMEAQGS